MKASRRTTKIGALLVVGAIVLGGCGGSGSKRLTKEEFAKKANALCVDYFLKTSKLGNPKSEAESIKLLVKMRTLFAKMVAETKKLQPPADEQAAVDRVSKLADQQVVLIDRMIAALKTHNLSNYNKLLKSGDAMDKEKNSLLTQLGATSCTK